MDYEIKDRVVVLTGAAGGIGAKLAHAFSSQGARVALLDREHDRLDEVAAALPGESIAIAVELTDDASVAAAIASLRSRWDAIEVLVNNAGTEFPTPLSSHAADFMDQWDGLLRNNVGSMVRLTRALLPSMPRGASIINQSSIWGLKGVPDFSAYVASKHAVIGLTRSLAWELGASGIRVNAVCPGWIRTQAALQSLDAMAAASGQTSAAMLEELLADQVTPTFLNPEDLADPFLFLASNGSRAITGQTLVVSFGEVMN
jgi:3-hydroxybutyrate dehydrogenase